MRMMRVGTALLLAAAVTSARAADAGTAKVDPEDAGTATAPLTGTAPLSGTLCGDGQKTIFVDLGNNPFRDSAFTGQTRLHRPVAGDRIGGNINTGDWAIGCSKEGRFVDEPVFAGESVRVVLLNPRTDFSYSLVQDGGTLKGSESVSRSTLDGSGPLCGPNTPECDRDDEVLVELDRDLRAYVAKLPAVLGDARGAMNGVSACARAGFRRCPSAGGAPGFEPAGIATLVEPASLGTTTGAEAVAFYTGFLERQAAFDRQAAALCEKWEEKIAAFASRLGRDEADRIATGIEDWSRGVTRRLTRYLGVRGLVSAIHEVYEPTRESDDLPRNFGDAESFYYWKSNHRRYCAPFRAAPAGAPAPGATLVVTASIPPALATTTVSISPTYATTTAAEERAIDARLTSAFSQYRRAARLLDHAQSARVLSLAPQDGNSRVIVSIVAEPTERRPEIPRGLPGEPAQEQVKALEKVVQDLQTAPERKPVAYQLSYEVQPAERFTASLGFAVPTYKRRGSGEMTSVDVIPAAFLHARLHVDDPGWRRYLRHFGIGLGLSAQAARALVDGDDPEIPDLMLGAFAWPIEEVSLGAGLAYAPDRAGMVHLGVFFTASADVPALVRMVRGLDSVLAR